jgi:hypothetical protein
MLLPEQKGKETVLVSTALSGDSGCEAQEMILSKRPSSFSYYYIYVSMGYDASSQALKKGGGWNDSDLQDS